jgi:hypothetical protein
VESWWEGEVGSVLGLQSTTLWESRMAKRLPLLEDSCKVTNSAPEAEEITQTQKKKERKLAKKLRVKLHQLDITNIYRIF